MADEIAQIHKTAKENLIKKLEPTNANQYAKQLADVTLSARQRLEVEQQALQDLINAKRLELGENNIAKLQAKIDYLEQENELIAADNELIDIEALAQAIVQ